MRNKIGEKRCPEMSGSQRNLPVIQSDQNNKSQFPNILRYFRWYFFILLTIVFIEGSGHTCVIMSGIESSHEAIFLSCYKRIIQLNSMCIKDSQVYKAVCKSSYVLNISTEAKLRGIPIFLWEWDFPRWNLYSSNLNGLFIFIVTFSVCYSIRKKNIYSFKM